MPNEHTVNCSLCEDREAPQIAILKAIMVFLLILTLLLILIIGMLIIYVKRIIRQNQSLVAHYSNIPANTMSHQPTKINNFVVENDSSAPTSMVKILHKPLINLTDSRQLNAILVKLQRILKEKQSQPVEPPAPDKSTEAISLLSWRKSLEELSSQYDFEVFQNQVLDTDLETHKNKKVIKEMLLVLQELKDEMELIRKEALVSRISKSEKIPISHFMKANMNKRFQQYQLTSHARELPSGQTNSGTVPSDRNSFMEEEIRNQNKLDQQRLQGTNMQSMVQNYRNKSKDLYGNNKPPELIQKRPGEEEGPQNSGSQATDLKKLLGRDSGQQQKPQDFQKMQLYSDISNSKNIRT